MAFQAAHTDFTRSPYTGLTRESWIEAAKYILEGLFGQLPSPEAPALVPRTETQVTYPHLTDPEEAQAAQRSAERFEGLTRSFFFAAPLIHDDPQVQVCGIGLRDYYRRQVLRCCTPGDPFYVGTYEDLRAMAGPKDPAPCFQQTVETCALVVCLWACREEIWGTYSQAEKDAVAALLSSYAHQHTVPQNWRLFNMLDLAFLHNEGYPIDEEIMLDHARSILAYYAGDGWYRDGHSFDYYSCWAFQFYAPLWNQWYGYEHLPRLAARFEENSRRLMETYPSLFDADGWTNMWGRSCIYRFASVSAFDGNLLLRRPNVDCGLARRIASGSLLQFLSRDDFLANGVPTLGFYRQFSPLVQGYSCAESVYWMGKAFLLLHLPASHPFWTETETNGAWEALAPGEVKSTVLDGPALAVTNHGANGTTFLRTGKVVRPSGDLHGMWNYGKLCYCTKYPWESAPRDWAEAQQYVIRNGGDGPCLRANVTLWHGERDGVLYRRQFFGYDLQRECTWMQALDLADFPVAWGIFRADRLRLYRRPVSITLGSFGFPDNGTEILRREKGGAKAVILKGWDSQGRPKQLAMTVFQGWEELDVLESSGTNPDSPRSLIVAASARRRKEYGYEPYLLCSQTLTREDHGDFTEEELFPLRAVQAEDPRGYSAFGATALLFADGSRKVLDFDGLEGRLLL